MSSIHNALRAGFTAAIAGGLAAGCAKSPPPPSDALNTRPLIVDDAMQQRDWQKSVCLYQNGSIRSYATRFPYVPSPNRPKWAAPFVETPIFIGETLMLPFSAITTPPGTSRTYNGFQMGPTSTGMPALPPSVSEQGPTPGYPNAKAGATPDAPQPLPSPAEPTPDAGGSSTPSNNTQTPGASGASPAPGGQTPSQGATPTPGSGGAAPAGNPPANSGTPVPQ